MMQAAPFSSGLCLQTVVFEAKLADEKKNINDAKFSEGNAQGSIRR